MFLGVTLKLVLPCAVGFRGWFLTGAQWVHCTLVSSILQRNHHQKWPLIVNFTAEASAKDVMSGAVKTQKLLERYGPWDVIQL